MLVAGNTAAANALNSNAGTRAGAFLRISPSARASGAGGAFTAVTGESICMDHNPAGIATVRSAQLSATYANWLADTKYGNVSMAWPAGKTGALGFSYTSLDYGSLTRVGGQDAYGVPIENGSFSANDMSLAVAYARSFRFMDIPVMAGAAVKKVRLSIDSRSSVGYGGDAGLDVVLGRNTLGFAVRNMGQSGVMHNRDEQLPYETALGISRRFPVRGQSLLVMFDGVRPIDHAMHYRAGVEYVYRSALSMRAGYRGNYDTDWMTLGAGFAYQNMRIDYAYAPFAVLGATHRMSFTFFFPDGFFRLPEKLKMKRKAKRPVEKGEPAEETAPVPVPAADQGASVLHVIGPKLTEPAVRMDEPLTIVEMIRALNLTARDINFETGSADIADGNIPLLDDIVKTLKKHSGYRVRVEGHTDSSGGLEDNFVLSQDRAENVRRYLIMKGLTAGSVIARGYGRSRPISDNSIEEGRRLNRRVQFIFITPEGQEIR